MNDNHIETKIQKSLSRYTTEELYTILADIVDIRSYYISNRNSIGTNIEAKFLMDNVKDYSIKKLEYQILIMYSLREVKHICNIKNNTKGVIQKFTLLTLLMNNINKAISIKLDNILNKL